MMDDERALDGEKLDEVMLPGFRFHPTDEELVGFYLKRKIQQRPLAIELIKQLDIYKYDPWDLPKLASSTGEKEWYFYCPRDRKYRNSARPNRVTGAGFWKATGTDRPIYSSEGAKCIGLKKSLVFYRGRAAKGVKTEWMMHEFRLPSMVDPTAPTRFTETNIPAHDSWAICRIFKKTNTNFHQRTNFSHQYHRTNLSPVSPDQTTTSSESPNSTSATSLAPQSEIPSYQNYNVSFNTIPTNFVQLDSSPPLDMYPGLEFATSYKNLSSTLSMSGLVNNGLEDLLFPHLQTTETTNKSSMVDLSSVFLNMSCPDHGCIGSACEGLGSVVGSCQLQHDHNQQYYNNIDDLFHHVHESDPVINGLMKGPQYDGEHWDDRYLGLSSYGLSNMNGGDAWRSNLVGWDTTSELSTLFSTTTTTKCYT